MYNEIVCAVKVIEVVVREMCRVKPTSVACNVNFVRRIPN